MSTLQCPGCNHKIGDKEHLILRRIKTVLRDGRIRCKCNSIVQPDHWIVSVAPA